ncbi:carboxymuconolactone decarboxylase family protein [Natronoglycomyces albus]|uniref:Carboxymuconolactone decarboxylase family protein n=1 Tax=Natronoglycomyces albus TaxID=2811108 RepID=A0A895XW22_9ACTN|nr:carboxymuconolactone decarboxylase family protein [Natronoglycomyces albus]QSB06726.1 carboxymuconolactone decarboxylase family protein [Natronoglycomyces albus]
MRQRLESIGRPPINLHRALAHTPELLAPLLDLIHAARFDAKTSRSARELMIVRIGQLEASEYELAHHLPMAVEAGLSEEQLGAVSNWWPSSLFDDYQRAVLHLADHLGGGAALDPRVVDQQLTPAEQAELVLVGSTYIAIARTIRALDIQVDDHLR